jgi:predicted N-acetyltransferase YhbS
MIQPGMSIRSPETEPETIATHNLLAQVFGTLPAEHERAESAAAWRARRAAWNSLVPSCTRSAFCDTTCLGSYQIDTRELRLGGALIRVGCIGAVATNPDYRNQGVASALMRDAEEIARQQGLGLLLLHGIGNFYQRFGYTNVADLTYLHMKLEDIGALPKSGCGVRRAAMDDIDVLLALYARHQGYFPRSRALQRELLQQRAPDELPVLAFDLRGIACGYLLPPDQKHPIQVPEVGADTWEVAVALLQYHAELVRATSEQADSLIWLVGRQSQLYYLLADHIPLDSMSRSIPDAEWMARTASLPDLFAALLPAWQASVDEHPAELRWSIGEATVEVRREHRTLFCDPVASGAQTIRLSQEIFTRLLFGYRPVAWAARQPGQDIPPALTSFVERLFWSNHLFVPKSDEF